MIGIILSIISLHNMKPVCRHSIHVINCWIHGPQSRESAYKQNQPPDHIRRWQENLENGPRIAPLDKSLSICMNNDIETIEAIVAVRIAGLD